MSDTVKCLEEMFASLCNGEWEHSHGIVIESLDNPGWIVRVCLTGTRHQSLEIMPVMTERSEHDWVHIAAKIEGHDRFIQCACGPKNLAEGLDLIIGHLR